MAATALPENEYLFDIDSDGDESKKKWKGSFKYKRLSLNARRQVDTFRSKLADGIDATQLPEDVVIFNLMIAHLRYGIIDFPTWWVEIEFGLSKDFYDMNIIEEMYRKCMNFEDEWEKKTYKE